MSPGKAKKKPAKKTAKKTAKTRTKKKTAKPITKVKKTAVKKTKTTSRKTAKNEDILALFLELFTDSKLNQKQRNVVAIKIMPESYKWTVRKKADMAGISERSWYRYERDPEVIRAINDYYPLMPNIKMPEILNRLNHEAVHAKNKEDRKWAIETLFKYSESGRQVAKAGAAQTNINMTPDEIRALRKKEIGKGLAQFGVTVKVNN